MELIVKSIEINVMKTDSDKGCIIIFCSSLQVHF